MAITPPPAPPRQQGGELGVAISGENDAEDALHDRVTFIENLVVAEAQHEEAECFEGSGAPSVSLAPLLVYRTVHLDDQAELRTREVER